MAHPVIQEHWGSLAVLIDTLEQLTSKEHVVTTTTTPTLAPTDIASIAEAVARELSRPGGPQIAQRAIANR